MDVSLSRPKGNLGTYILSQALFRNDSTLWKDLFCQRPLPACILRWLIRVGLGPGSRPLYPRIVPYWVLKGAVNWLRQYFTKWVDSHQHLRDCWWNTTHQNDPPMRRLAPWEQTFIAIILLNLVGKISLYFMIIWRTSENKQTFRMAFLESF